MSPSENHTPPGGSYTAPASHSTAAAIGKEYRHEFAPSDDPDKSCQRTTDGHIPSGQYASRGRPADSAIPVALQMASHHVLEDWLGRRPVRWLLARLARRHREGATTLERILNSLHNPTAPLWHRLIYGPIHLLIEGVVGRKTAMSFGSPSIQLKATVRGLNVVTRSIAEFGLTVPQRFSAPLFAVWNFTNRCNLACKHCYQDSDHDCLADELTLDEKLDLVDQMGADSLGMLAISGGEPTISKDLLPVVARAGRYGMHMSLATNGTAVTPKLAGQLAEAGMRYVEISLDSVDPDRHDAFRGVPGMWARAVAGARNVTATDGLRLGVAMCVHQGNLHEVPALMDFAENELGADCFAHFNFIPVGRGLKMVTGDLTPAQREGLLATLNRKMQAGGMGVISTAPQLGRVCLAGAMVGDDRVACSHAGSGSGMRARVVAKYLGGCGAGRTYVCIEPNGDVTPCVYLPHRVMGNVRDLPLNRIFRESVFWDILNDRDHRLHHCEVCAFRQYCGGCRARADAYFGQLHAGDPGCIFNDKHWQQLVEDGVAVMSETTDPEQMDLPKMRHGLA